MGVGIPELDQEHRHFISMVDGLNRAVENRAKLSEIRQKMQSMLDDWERHSSREEALLDQQNYSGSAQHAEKHKMVSQQLHAIMAGLGDDSFGYEWLSAGLQIRDILLDHLLNEDMKYRDYCGEVTPAPLAGGAVEDGTGLQA